MALDAPTSPPALCNELIEQGFSGYFRRRAFWPTRSSTGWPWGVCR